MKYYHLHGETAYCGTDIDLYFAEEGEIDEEEYCESMLQELFDSYSYLATGWGNESDDPDFEENFKADCHVYIEEIPHEHGEIIMGAD